MRAEVGGVRRESLGGGRRGEEERKEGRGTNWYGLKSEELGLLVQQVEPSGAQIGGVEVGRDVNRRHEEVEAVDMSRKLAEQKGWEQLDGGGAAPDSKCCRRPLLSPPFPPISKLACCNNGACPHGRYRHEISPPRAAPSHFLRTRISLRLFPYACSSLFTCSLSRLTQWQRLSHLRRRHMQGSYSGQNGSSGKAP